MPAGVEEVSPRLVTSGMRLHCQRPVGAGKEIRRQLHTLKVEVKLKCRRFVTGLRSAIAENNAVHTPAKVQAN